MTGDPSPIHLTRSLLGRLADQRSAAGRRWLGRAISASLLASIAGVLAGVVPGAVALGVQGITGSPHDTAITRFVRELAPAAAGAPWVWVLVALVGVVGAVFVAFLSSETAARLTADTTAELRIAMMRAAIDSSPRAIEELGSSLGGPSLPPGMQPPPGAKPKGGIDAVKLTVLRDAQSTAEFLVATLVTLPQAIFALAALSVDLAESGALSVLAGGAGIFVLSRLLGLRASRGVAKATQALQASDAAVFSEVSEKLTHLEDLRLSGARPEALAEVSLAAHRTALARRGFARALSVSGQITGILGAMAPLLVLVVLSLSHRAPSPGEVAKLLLSIPVVVARLQAMDALRIGAIEKRPVLASVQAVLNLGAHPDPSRARLSASQVEGAEVAFRSVTFVPQGSDKAILREVSLDIPEGSVVGLCGPSGSGKSTMLRLLLRLDDPTEGAVSVGGVDVREVHTEDLPRVFATLGQQTRLLGRSIAANVTLGIAESDSLRRERARKALKKAQVDELASDEGLDRLFSAAPPNLSGGEQRRVLLARALARQAPVLVLDEPEAGLPGGQVQAVLDAAVTACKGRTLIVATHAPDLLRSDFNVLLEGGTIVARGTHRDLLRDNPDYAKLFARKPS